LSAAVTERRWVTGTGRVVVLRGAGVRLTTNPATFFGTFVDVAERRAPPVEPARLEEQTFHAERLRTLGQLAAGMAHEINNPASIAIGGVDLARRRLAAAAAAAKRGDLAEVRGQLEQLEQALGYAEDGALRVSQAASRFGGFANLRYGRLERLDPNELVRRALALVRNEIRHRAQLEVALGEVPHLVAYGERLVQVLTSLLVNAGQAIDGPAEQHTIAVTTAASDGVVSVTVRDTGIAVARDALERLFEPFGPTRGKDRSAGFGLSVARQIVQQHGGDIGVYTPPDGGVAFVVRLPLVNGLVAEDDRPARGARVLVVDDEPYLLDLIAQVLGEHHEVVVAESGQKALELLSTDRRFDVVICDLMMPDVDGVALHGWLRERRPALAARTVFCTGGAFTERAERYVRDGNHPVLSKPFSGEDVLRTVAAALRGADKNKV
jgi:signal transduction histidine kinase/CheY-like chemotaxis protein